MPHRFVRCKIIPLKGLKIPGVTVLQVNQCLSAILYATSHYRRKESRHNEKRFHRKFSNYYMSSSRENPYTIVCNGTLLALSIIILRVPPIANVLRIRKSTFFLCKWHFSYMRPANAQARMHRLCDQRMLWRECTDYVTSECSGENAQIMWPANALARMHRLCDQRMLWRECTDYVTSECSGENAHLCILAKAFAGRIHKVNKKFVKALPGPEVIKLFSYSTQLSTKFILLINVKMPTIVGILKKK